MARTFIHSFFPPSASPVPGSTVDLEISDIEDAGIREVLQTPGAAYGAWSLLDALLTTTGPGTPFVFKEPLGQAREVKVALSGLFGRLVARAYLERYLGLSIFAHLGNKTLSLDQRRRIVVERLLRGDLPDWVACAPGLTTLTVAEAKGSHDPAGPDEALRRGWKQAQRIDVKVGGRKASIKRIAIATRWGAATNGPRDCHLSVHDPDEEGEKISSDDHDAIYVGLLRHHIANLIEPLGHEELADALRHLTGAGLPRDEVAARSLLQATPIKDVEGATAIEGLVGAVVTRAGPIASPAVEPADQETLARLDLRPVFVGVARELIDAAIQGDASIARDKIKENTKSDEFVRPDRAGGWIVRLGSGRRVIGIA